MIQSQNIEQELREKVNCLAVADSIVPCRLCLLLIMVMEAYFIITWFIFERAFADWQELRYLIAYTALFAFAAVSSVLLTVYHRDLESGYKKIRNLQTIAATVIMLWSVVITIFDADHHTEFSYIIYATIVVMLPAVVYIDTVVLNCLYLVCDLVLVAFTVIIRPDNYRSTILNFLVFAVVSLMACNTYSRIKFTSLKRAVELQEVADRDHLTGLYNRQKLNEMSAAIVGRNAQEHTELSCVMMDVDDFKKINDTRGHLVGDTVLRGIANVVLDVTLRHGGLAFRYGGEEFLLLFSDCSSRQACNVVEKIQKKLSRGISGFDEKVTLSFGVYTAVPTRDEHMERYFAAADELLYQSKENGKNRYSALDQAYACRAGTQDGGRV